METLETTTKRTRTSTVSTKPIGIALVGMGGIASQHLDAIKALMPKAKLLAVCEVDENKAPTLLNSREMNTKVFSRYEELLHHPGISLVDICLPNNLHASATMLALRAGKTVICEKPAGCSLREIDEVCAAEKETGQRAFSIFQNRYGVGVRTLQKLVRKGMTGRLLSAQVSVNWYRPDVYYSNGWRGTWQGEGGGCLLTCGIHAIDVFLDIVGRPKMIFAQVGHRGHAIETEDVAQVLGRFERDDAPGQIQVTTNSPEESTSLKFVFEKMAVLSNPAPYTFADAPWRFLSVDSKMQANLDQQVKALGYTGESDIPREVYAYHQAQLADVIRYLQDGGPLPQVPVSETRKIFELITRIYQSVHTNQPSTEEITPTSLYYERLNGGQGIAE